MTCGRRGVGTYQLWILRVAPGVARQVGVKVKCNDVGVFGMHMRVVFLLEKKSPE